MNESLNLVTQTIDEGHEHESASTRRQLVAGAAATIGGMGLLAMPEVAMARNDATTILNIAATAEVLATIVNTIGGEQVRLDPVTKANVDAAAREELIHYQVLRSVGAKPATKRIWVPDSVFANKENFLNALVYGDQVFINAYLIGVTAFGNAGKATFARYSAEFMGAEAVHRALAKQSLGQLGNDRAFMAYRFRKIETAVKRLQTAGFGFGAKGSGRPGQFYNFDTVSKRTPNPATVNTRAPN